MTKRKLDSDDQICKIAKTKDLLQTALNLEKQVDNQNKLIAIPLQYGQQKYFTDTCIYCDNANGEKEALFRLLEEHSQVKYKTEQKNCYALDMLDPFQNEKTRHFYTQSSLIVCHYSAITKWKNTFLASNKIIVETRKQLKNLTYNSIPTKCIVIINSYVFFQCIPKVSESKDLILYGIDTVFDNSVNKSKKNPNFAAYKWNRIIYDINPPSSEKFTLYYKALSANYKWIISYYDIQKDPFLLQHHNPLLLLQHPNSMNTFLITGKKEEYAIDKLTYDTDCGDLLKKISCGYSSAKTQLDIISVNMNKIEEYYYNKLMKKIEQYELIDRYREWVDKQHKIYDDIHQMKSNTAYSCINTIKRHLQSSVKKQILLSVRSIQKREQLINTIEYDQIEKIVENTDDRTITLLNQLKFIQNEFVSKCKGECPICLEKEHIITILPCAHVLCNQCCDSMERKQCPFCRCKFNKRNKLYISRSVINKCSEGNNDKCHAYSQLGDIDLSNTDNLEVDLSWTSKIRYILDFINKHKNEKILIIGKNSNYINYIAYFFDNHILYSKGKHRMCNEEKNKIIVMNQQFVTAFLFFKNVKYVLVLDKLDKCHEQILCNLYYNAKINRIIIKGSVEDLVEKMTGAFL